MPAACARLETAHGWPAARIRASSSVSEHRAIAQTHACHAVKLGEGFSNNQSSCCFSADALPKGLRPPAENPESIRPRPAPHPRLRICAAARFHKGRLCQLAGGVVGLTEEHHICTRVHRIRDGFRHRKIVFFPQEMPFHRAACRFKGGGILGKSGGRYQCSAGLCSQRQPEDEVCRAVAAQQPFGGHSLSHRQFFSRRARHSGSG